MCDSIEKYKTALCRAVRKFYKEDAETLFSEKKRSECPMAGCIYRYLWEELTNNKPSDSSESLHIDTEYARMVDDSTKTNEPKDKTILIQLQECMDRDCAKMQNCCLLLRQHLMSRQNIKDVSNFETPITIRPDIIVHRRNSPGQNNNFLIVEVKHSGSKPDCIKYDQAKLLHSTCLSTTGLRYNYGALVILNEKSARIRFYSNGDICCSYRVTKVAWKEAPKELYDAHKNTEGRI